MSDEISTGQGLVWFGFFISLGAALYYSLPREPALVVVILFWSVLLLVSIFKLCRGANNYIFLVVSFGLSSGVLSAQFDAYFGRQLRLENAETVVLEGVIINVEQRQKSDRLTILPKNIPDLSGGLIRISSRTKSVRLSPGDNIRVRTRLLPLPGPILPNGYDFGRALWFKGFSATGYSIGKVTITGKRQRSSWFPDQLDVHLWRHEIGRRILSAGNGETADLANALITGDRSGIDKTSLEFLRKSGLAHILAISGMHMGLLAFSVYWIVRLLLVAFLFSGKGIAERKLAACAALTMATVYLVLSGSSISTIRAYVMICIAFLAVLADRNALTMRNLAIALIVIVLIQPFAVLEAGFQMSFMATAALIVCYAKFSRPNGDQQSYKPRSVFSQIQFFIYGIGLTSLVAGFATAPIATYHFQRVAIYGLLANLLAMPIVMSLVMPGVLLTLILMPIGFEFIALEIMQYGIGIVLKIAEMTSELYGSTRIIAAMPKGIYFIILVSMSVFLILKTQLRWVTMFPLVVSLIVAANINQPDIYISRNGNRLAYVSPSGSLAFIGSTRSTYDMQNWMRAHGDQRIFDKSLVDINQFCDRTACIAKTNKNVQIAFVKRYSAFAEDCKKADIVVSRLIAPRECSHHALVLDKMAFLSGGAKALYAEKHNDEGNEILSIVIDHAEPLVAGRPWHQGYN
ncbi:MAG: ComEC/Rec2 family competence protein [Cohaesibacteraceae bacterium]|nr:ComEC/Rec2 family competence protein [Cohaesibacteraceae bacterium]